MTCALTLAAPVGCSRREPPSVRTTDGRIALGNLDAGIEGRRKQFEHAKGFEVGRTLTELLLTRARFLGRDEDVRDARATADQLVERYPDRYEPLIDRAKVKVTAHEYQSAREDLARARALRPGAGERLEDTIRLATQQDVLLVLENRESAAKARASFTHLADLAAAKAELGETEAADALYERALKAYRDVSPFPVAFVAFQRGLMWAMVGDDAKARTQFQEALRRVPGYAAAQLQLTRLDGRTQTEPTGTN